MTKATLRMAIVQATRTSTRIMTVAILLVTTVFVTITRRKRTMLARLATSEKMLAMLILVRFRVFFKVTMLTTLMTRPMMLVNPMTTI